MPQWASRWKDSHMEKTATIFKILMNFFCPVPCIMTQARTQSCGGQVQYFNWWDCNQHHKVYEPISSWEILLSFITVLCSCVISVCNLKRCGIQHDLLLIGWSVTNLPAFKPITNIIIHISWNSFIWLVTIPLKRAKSQPNCLQMLTVLTVSNCHHQKRCFEDGSC